MVVVVAVAVVVVVHFAVSSPNDLLSGYVPYLALPFPLPPTPAPLEDLYSSLPSPECSRMPRPTPARRRRRQCRRQWCLCSYSNNRRERPPQRNKRPNLQNQDYVSVRDTTRIGTE